MAANEIMHQQYQAFLEEPTAANYRRARSAMLALDDFEASPLLLHEVARLCDRRRFDEAHERLEAMAADWALSPRYHELAARVAEQLDDEEDAELERFVAACCLRGVLATGDGSRRFPYLVTYNSDAQDILRFRGLEPLRQALHEHRGRRYDVVECHDGTRCWFDVTDIFRQLPALEGAEAVRGER